MHFLTIAHVSFFLPQLTALLVKKLQKDPDQKTPPRELRNVYPGQQTCSNLQQPTILGGEVLAPSGIPWFVQLENCNGTCSQCGGSLIHPRVVLTRVNQNQKRVENPKSMIFIRKNVKKFLNDLLLFPVVRVINKKRPHAPIPLLVIQAVFNLIPYFNSSP